MYDVGCLAWSLQAEKYMEEANYSQATYVGLKAGIKFHHFNELARNSAQ
jgi:hypothetical protein